MAVITTKVDDLNNEMTDAQTVLIVQDGVFYEIDLAEANKAKLDKALAPFVKVAREVNARDVFRQYRSTSAGSTGDDPGAIRAWARDHGYEVSDRGRVPQEVVDAYNSRGHGS